MDVVVVVTVREASDAVAGEGNRGGFMVAGLELVSEDVSCTPHARKNPDDGEECRAKRGLPGCRRPEVAPGDHRQVAARSRVFCGERHRPLMITDERAARSGRRLRPSTSSALVAAARGGGCATSWSRKSPIHGL